MSKKDKILKKTIQEKVRRHEYAYDEKAWQHMEMLLDNPPVSANAIQSNLVAKKILFSILVALISLLILIIIFSQKNKSTTINELHPLPKKYDLSVHNTTNRTTTIANHSNTEKNIHQPIEKQALTIKTKTKNSTLDDKGHLFHKHYTENRFSESSIPIKTESSLYKEADLTPMASIFTPSSKESVLIPNKVLFNRLHQQFNQYFKYYQPEKIYLSLKKDKFDIGETISFDLYGKQYDASPSQMRSIAYVELLDKDGKVVKDISLPIINGHVNGKIETSRLVQGQYSIKAFTNWQRNRADFFTQKIYIGKQKNNTINTKVTVEFHAEGAEPVIGLPLKMAFKIRDTNGLPIAAKGYLLNDKNEKISQFETYFNGIGTFEYTPKTNEKISAYFITKDGQHLQYGLSTPQTKGYALHLKEQAKTHIILEVHSTENEHLNIIAHNKDGIFYTNTIIAQKGKNTLTIPTRNLGRGLMQISLFDSKEIERASRLIFVNRDKKLQLDIHTEVMANQKAIIELNVRDERSIPMPGGFWISIQKEQKKEHSLLSYMLLEAELKNPIFHAAAYLDDIPSTIDKSLALDNLLITQEWKHFSWKNSLSNEFAMLEFSKENNTILPKKKHNIIFKTIEGTIINDVGQPLVGAHISSGNYGTITDFDGNFSLEIPSQTTELTIHQIGFATKKILVEQKINYTVQLDKSKEGWKDIAYDKNNPVEFVDVDSIEGINPEIYYLYGDKYSPAKFAVIDNPSRDLQKPLIKTREKQQILNNNIVITPPEGSVDNIASAYRRYSNLNITKDKLHINTPTYSNHLRNNHHSYRQFIKVGRMGKAIIELDIPNSKAPLKIYVEGTASDGTIGVTQEKL